MSVVRIMFLFCLAVLTSCTGQDLAKYALPENNFPKHIERQYINSSAGYDTARVHKVERKQIVAGVDARNFNIPVQKIESPVQTVDVSRKDVHEASIISGAEKADPGTVRRMVGAVTTANPTADSSHAIALSPFLDRLVAEDKEDQDLRKKTIICRGC